MTKKIDMDFIEKKIVEFMSCVIGADETFFPVLDESISHIKIDTKILDDFIKVIYFMMNHMKKSEVTDKEPRSKQTNK